MIIDNIKDEELLKESSADEDNKKGSYPPPPPPSTEINCALEVTLRTNNSVVYVCKGSRQCFNFTALKCCGKGDISITPVYPQFDRWGKKTVECFGTFKLVDGGICFDPDNNHLKANDHTSIVFKAKSCGVTVLFTVTFVFDPCKCCCGCKDA